MSDILYGVEPFVEHLKANAVLYGLGVSVLVICMYLTRPYSTAIFFHGAEIAVYLFIMHTVAHVAVRLFAWFSNETKFKSLYEGKAIDVVEWTTPWPRFWDMDIYDPRWIVWIEVALVVIIIGLVRYYRPMKVHHRLKVRVAPPPKKTPKGGIEEEEDDWGVSKTRRFTLPDDMVADVTKKKK